MFNATYDKEIAEFTVCIRFMIDFYNNALFHMVDAREDDTIYFLDRIGWIWGMERDEFQAGVVIVACL